MWWIGCAGRGAWTRSWWRPLTGQVDDAVAAFCEREGIGCFRGSEQDVLDRFYQAARANHADVVVRITADCPLIDPTSLIECSRVSSGGIAITYATFMRYTYPDGLDTEVFSFSALERAWREAQQAFGAGACYAVLADGEISHRECGE